MKGAPLRFAGAVVGGWVMGRFAVLWSTTVPIIVPVVPPAIAEQRAGPVEPIADGGARRAALPTPGRAVVMPRRTVMVARRVAPPPDIPTDPPIGRPAVTATAEPGPQITPALVRPAVAPWASVAIPSRLHVDAWLVARPGGGDSLAFGQLGASQGGARLTYALDRRVALSGRVSAPLRGTGREIGVGVDLKPTRLPLHVLIEQRIDLDDGGARPAVIAFAGGSAALPWRGRIDAYGQAGGVRRRGGFVDAAAIVTRPLATRGKTRLEAGGGAWGAAQRAISRLDVGPSFALVTPGAGGMLRLQLDYRARVAGRARPGSGPAITLGGSF